MKIDGLHMNNGGLQYIENNKVAKVSASKPPKGDTVEISQSPKSRVPDVVAQGVLTVDYPPRTEHIRNAQQLLSDGSYNKQDYLEKLAEEMLGSPALTDTVSSISSGQKDSQTVRTESVTRVNDQVQQNYYDNKAVMEEIAGRLIDVLGFSRLF